MFVGLLFYIPEHNVTKIGNSEFSAPSGSETLEVNKTAAWAVDREFVIYSFLGVVGPMVTPGSPDALGEQTH